MRILALDLGTRTGWARWEDEVFASGTWELASTAVIADRKKQGLDRCCDQRFAALNERLKEEELRGHLDWIYFEDVLFSTTTYQTQLWASLRGVVVLRYPLSRIKAVPVPTLKAFATGHGNATKQMMAKALLKTNTGLRLPEKQLKSTVYLLEYGRRVDDNEIDARHLLHYALTDLHLCKP